MAAACEQHTQDAARDFHAICSTSATILTEAICATNALSLHLHGALGPGFDPEQVLDCAGVEDILTAPMKRRLTLRRSLSLSSVLNAHCLFDTFCSSDGSSSASMDLRGCCASAVDAVFCFRSRNRPDLSVPVRAPAHDHTVPQLLLATENLAITRRCLSRIAAFFHPPRLQPWLLAACSGASPRRSLGALSASCDWAISMLDMARDSILAARAALHSSEQFRLNRFEECSDWLCVEGCAVPPNMHLEVVVHNQRLLMLAWLLQPLAPKAAVSDNSMYKVGTAPEDAIGLHIMYRGMLHSIASICVVAEMDAPHRDDGIAGLERLLSLNALSQVRAAAAAHVCYPPYSQRHAQAGLGVQWRACAQGLTAIASIKRSLSQFASLLAASASRLPATPPTAVSSAHAVSTAATAATSAPLPAAVLPSPSPQHRRRCCSVHSRIRLRFRC